MDTQSSRHAGKRWVATPSASLSTPKGLSSISAIMLCMALLVLAAFIGYVLRRRRTASARWKRGKSTAPLPVVEAELIVDDPRREGRVAARRNLPSLLLDRMRGLSEGLWNRTEALEKDPEDADVAQYSTGRQSDTGPRFLATTASGKALQVVVKTEAVPARHNSAPTGAQWQAAHEPSGLSLPSPNAAAGAESVRPGTPVQRHESRALDAAEPISSPFGSSGADAAAASAAASGSAGAAPGFNGAGTCIEGSGGGAGLGGRPFRNSHSEAPRSGVLVTDSGYTLSSGGGTLGGAPPAMSGGGGLGFGSGAGRGGDGSQDPAVAWYSRALHRQVSAAALAAQAAAGVPKAHLA